MQNETLAASAVKVAIVNSGAAISTMSNPGVISAVAGVLTATYTAIQILKSLPWITEYVIAVKNGVMRHNWSQWRKIGRKEETRNDNIES